MLLEDLMTSATDDVVADVPALTTAARRRGTAVRRTRRAVTAVGAVAATAVIAAGASLVLSSGDETVRQIDAADAQEPPARVEAGRTELTLLVADCEGCTLTLVNAGAADGTVAPWSSEPVTVADGTAVMTVDSRRTEGSQLTIETPDEGQLGYVTTVVTRYGDHVVGDEIDAAEAARQRRATGCWDGTDLGEVSLELQVAPVTVEGVRGPVPGTRAWTRVTLATTAANRLAPEGVLGSQDVDLCLD